MGRKGITVSLALSLRVQSSGQERELGWRGRPAKEGVKRGKKRKKRTPLFHSLSLIVRQASRLSVCVCVSCSLRLSSRVKRLKRREIRHTHAHILSAAAATSAAVTATTTSTHMHAHEHRHCISCCTIASLMTAPNGEMPVRVMATTGNQGERDGSQAFEVATHKQHSEAGSEREREGRKGVKRLATKSG